MKELSTCLASDAKRQFFDRLSHEAYFDLPTDLLTILEGIKTERRPYVIFDTLPLSRHFCSSIREAAEQFWIMATSTAKIFQYLPEFEILEWGYPEDYIPQFLACNTPPSEMRLDIAVNPQAFASDRYRPSDFKILESNSSTPGFWAETFVFNELIANHFGYHCPNHKLAATHTKDLVEYLTTSFSSYSHGRDTVYFSFPYAGNHEDILSFDARVGHFEGLGGKARFLYTEEFVLETDIAIDSGLKTFDGDPVRYLFLHYPNEWLIQDAGEISGDTSLHFLPPSRPWDYIEQLVLDGKLHRIPPITSEIIQNKAFFAFLWEGVHQQRFDQETEQVIRSLVPQTYCTYDEAQSQGLHQVWEKPIYGREGAGIILWENRQELINTYDPEFDDNDWYQNMLAVFQQNCDLPIYTFADERVLLMFTVYLSPKGRATGIGCRAVPASKRVIDAQQGLWFPVGLANSN